MLEVIYERIKISYQVIMFFDILRLLFKIDTEIFERI